MKNGFGGRLRSFRTQLGLSAPKLAALMTDGGRPISENMIREIESGRRREIGVSTVLRLSTALGIPPVCLIVNHRDPFGLCDVPGLEGTGLRNHEVSVMFDVSVPISSIHEKWSVSEELRFSVMVNRYLHDLETLRKRNQLACSQYHDFVMGEGHYASVVDVLLYRSDTIGQNDNRRVLEERFQTFFLERGGWIRWRIGRVLKRLEALEELYGCRDDGSFRRMLRVCADETDWAKRSRSQEADSGDDELFPLVTPPNRSEMRAYEESTPYELMKHVLRDLAGRRRAHPRGKPKPESYEYTYGTSGGYDVGMYLDMAVSLSQIAVDDAMLEPTDIYRKMDERFEDIIKERGLPPFELLLGR